MTKQFINEQNFPYPIPLMSKFPVLSISLFSAESVKTLYRKVPCFTNKVLEWYKHMFQFFLRSPYSLDDKIRATVQLIIYTVLQNCLSLFTIHCNSQFPYVQLASVVELSDFFVEGCHLSKIRLGANVS